MAFKPTFLINPERFRTLAAKGLEHMTAEERARAEIPVLGATEDEIRALMAQARRGAQECAQTFAKLETYCLFIGYPRSGHSLVGSLLDAHENAVIAHELNALKFLDIAKFSAPELYWLILENSRIFAILGRQWGDYRYAVPGLFQGSFHELKIIGDKKGAGSTQLLSRKPELLDRLRKIVPLPLKVVHITRNPYDNIATVARKDTGNIGQAARFYFSLCEANRKIMQQVGRDSVLEFRHEEFITEPRAILKRVCKFVGLRADDQYLSACAAVVKERPSRSRDKAEWNPELRNRIAQVIEKYEFLSGYTFD